MPGEIVKELIISLEKRIAGISDVKVSDARVGLGYTAIKLNTGHVGVCHTLLNEFTCCQRIERAGEVSGSSALEVTRLANSWKLAEATIGIATINALSQTIFEESSSAYSIIENADYIGQIEIKENDSVALVGYIKPFVPIIKSKTKNLYIIERSLAGQDEDILPDTACEEIIPKASIVIITGSAIVNGTIDRLLELSRNAREVGVVGPTASMIPDPLFSRGVTIVGGIKVTDPTRLLQVISEGGGTQQFKGACKHIIIRSLARDHNVLASLV